MSASISFSKKLRTIRSSCEGYLTMRTSPGSPPPMVRRYCVLIGTGLCIYNSEEDAQRFYSLKGEFDILGVQEWDGKANTHIYMHGFLFATAQSKIFYAYSDTPRDKEMWMRAIQVNLVTTTMPELGRCIPGHGIQQTTVSPASSVSSSMVDSDSNVSTMCYTCPSEASTVGRLKCFSCEGSFCDKHCSQEIPLPQCNQFYAKRVCDHCYWSQVVLNYLKAMIDRLKAGICVYPTPLDVSCPIELLTPDRPFQTEASDIALNLFKEGAITAEELEVLLLADRQYQDQHAEEPEIPLDVAVLALHREFASADFSVFKCVILLHKNLEKDSILFKPIAEKLLALSYSHIDDIELYWPQVVHAYLRIPTFDFEKLFWMDSLILSICSRSIHLALLLVWQLQGAIEDSCALNATKEIVDKYPRIVRLMADIEVFIMGRRRSSVFEGSTSRTGPPKATPEQIELFNVLFTILATFRIECSNRNERPSLHQILLKSTTYKEDPSKLAISLSAASWRGTEDDSEEFAVITKDKCEFKDFSKFQQYLLTPSEQRGVSINKFSVNNEEKIGQGVVDQASTRSRTMSNADKTVLAHYFSDERDFFQQITDIAEELRFVPIEERKKLLPGKLSKLKVPEMAYVPLVKASDAFERIIRIPPNEATAFSTKARVPIMLIFEVLRGKDRILNSSGSPNKMMPCTTSERDVEVGQLIEKVSPIFSFPNNDEVIRPMGSRDIESRGVVDSSDDGKSRRSNELSLDPELRATVRDMYYTVPETPIATHCPGTPAASSPVETVMAIESSSSDTLCANVPPPSRLDLSSLQLTEEALERETERNIDMQAAFGESWAEKKARLKELSPYGHLPGWNVVSMIGKSNDDLRQEVFALQVIQKFLFLFKAAGLPMWLKCYRIIATSSSTGLIETIQNAMSLDGLKKRDGYGSLALHFEKSYGPKDAPSYEVCMKNFVNSMAAYSLVCYFLQIKDRHNGNIMLDDEGHVVHIDYGFLLGIAPGGSFSIETAPFKLTTEMVDAMGGVEGKYFLEFVSLCTHGFLACQKSCDDICDFVEAMAVDSTYPCFGGKDINSITQKLRARFKVSYSKPEVVAHVMYLIRRSNGNYSTRQYDNFQRMTNGIMP